MPKYPTSVPPELSAAIATAASRYGFPPEYLVTVWRRESGSTFPNPAVNDAGYGGLFGTRNWNASTQAQADEAARVLAKGLEYWGTFEDAYNRYYVHGETPPGGGRVRPGGDAGGGFLDNVKDVAGGIWKYDPLLGGPTGFLFGAGHGLTGALSHVPVVGGIFSFLHSVQMALEDFLGKILWLFDPLNWLRMVEFVVGIGLMIFSLAMLARSLAPSDSAPAKAAGAVEQGAAKAMGAPGLVLEAQARRRRKAYRRRARAPKAAGRRHLTERQLDYRRRRQREG